MKKIILLLVVILTILFLPKIDIKKTPPVIISEVKAQTTVEEMISEVAPRWGQDPKLIYKISYCESNHRIVVHDGGYGKGVTGIHRRTFDGWLPDYVKDNGETLDYNSSYDQLKMMSYVFSKGDSYRNQWTTYVAYMRGGTYTFYSKLLKGWYTVTCK